MPNIIEVNSNLSVDCVIFGFDGERLKVLLIEEKDIDKKIVNISIKPSATGFKKQEFNRDLFCLF